jgi:uncharacterized paraquat-inducible protein A
MLADPNKGDHLTKELHIHGCSECDRDFLSYYIKVPHYAKCAHCIEKVYADTKRDLWLRAETERAFREDASGKR